MLGLALIARLALAAQVTSAPVANGDKVIVRIAARQSEISIVSTSEGVRYSAADKSGQLLVSKATLDELKQQHPALYRLLAPSVCVSTDAPTAYAGMSAD